MVTPSFFICAVEPFFAGAVTVLGSEIHDAKAPGW